LPDELVVDHELWRPTGRTGGRGKRKALVTVARSILVIIFYLLANPEARFCDLGPGRAPAEGEIYRSASAAAARGAVPAGK